MVDRTENRALSNKLEEIRQRFFELRRFVWISFHHQHLEMDTCQKRLGMVFRHHVSATFEHAQIVKLQTETTFKEQQQRARIALEKTVNHGDQKVLKMSEALKDKGAEVNNLRQQNTILQQAMLREQMVNSKNDNLRVRSAELEGETIESMRIIQDLKEEKEAIKDSCRKEILRMVTRNEYLKSQLLQQEGKFDPSVLSCRMTLMYYCKASFLRDGLITVL